jgi:hypothetical protein
VNRKVHAGFGPADGGSTAGKLTASTPSDWHVVMCKSVEEAEDAYRLTQEVLENQLALKLHERNDDSPIARTRIVKPTQRTIEFLGNQFNGSRIWPAGSKRQKLSDKLKQIKSRSASVIELLTSTRDLVEGWIAAYGFTDIEVAPIDAEVNKQLWKALSKLGWKLETEEAIKKLTSEQRGNSGIWSASEYLNNIRRGLSNKDEALLAKYWTIS